MYFRGQLVVIITCIYLSLLCYPLIFHITQQHNNTIQSINDYHVDI